mmetsp:Transcript_14786/g.34855  ORF Transcript_14786/g.34855 Transcript_14786/m.34855 type:complete len:234 (+) Transcript_14786:2068-2769(+)
MSSASSNWNREKDDFFADWFDSGRFDASADEVNICSRLLGGCAAVEDTVEGTSNKPFSEGGSVNGLTGDRGTCTFSTLLSLRLTQVLIRICPRLFEATSLSSSISSVCFKSYQWSSTLFSSSSSCSRASAASLANFMVFFFEASSFAPPGTTLAKRFMNEGFRFSSFQLPVGAIDDRRRSSFFLNSALFLSSLLTKGQTPLSRSRSETRMKTSPSSSSASIMSSSYKRIRRAN